MHAHGVSRQLAELWLTRMWRAHLAPAGNNESPPFSHSPGRPCAPPTRLARLSLASAAPCSSFWPTCRPGQGPGSAGQGHAGWAASIC